MSRSSTIGSATLSAVEAGNGIIFLELLIDETSSPEVTVRIHSGLGTISWGSRSWTGAGSLLSIDGIRQTNKFNPAPFRASLSGVDSTVTNIVFNQNYYRRPCKVYLGGMSDGALVEDPGVIHSGFIESLEMELAGETGDVVTLTSESEFILFKRSRNVRYSDRQLQSEYSGDVGLEYLESVATAKVVWRGKNNPLGSGSSSPGFDIGPNFVTF